jgi:DNA (cytosine-5)-methyltransferase 1
VLKILDLFAGAGGLSLGFEMTKKYQTVAIIEKDKYASMTFEKNRENRIIRKADINDLDLLAFKSEIDSVDIVIGGPPCQGFSNANRQHSHLINGNNQLIKKYIQTLLIFKPKVFLMENVSMLISDTHKFFCTAEDISNSIFEAIIKRENLTIMEKNVFVEDIKACKIHGYDDLLFAQINEALGLIKLLVRKSTKNIQDINIDKISVKLACLLKKSTIINLNDLSKNEDILKLETLTDVSLNNDNWHHYKESLENVQKLLIALRLILELEKYNIDYKLQFDSGRVIANVASIKVIDYIKKSLENIYNLDSGILNTYEYDVPQIRKRFIMIGVLKTTNKNIKIDDIPKSNKRYTVRDAISDLENIVPSNDNIVNSKEYNGEMSDYTRIIRSKEDKIWNHVITKSKVTSIMKFNQLKQGQNFHDLSDVSKKNYSNPSKTQNSIYLRLEYKKPSNTVVNIRKSMWIHPVIDRAISVREAARIQSFPDNYMFFGTKDNMYQQIGNAVPPLFAKKIAESIYDKIFK